VKPTIIIVKEGPMALYFEVPKMGRSKFAVTPRTDVNNMPRKQYLIWRRLIPIEFLKFLIRKNNPPNRNITK
jgi:hypothetical protein